MSSSKLLQKFKKIFANLVCKQYLSSLVFVLHSAGGSDTGGAGQASALPLGNISTPQCGFNLYSLGNQNLHLCLDNERTLKSFNSDDNSSTYILDLNCLGVFSPHNLNVVVAHRNEYSFINLYPQYLFRNVLPPFLTILSSQKFLRMFSFFVTFSFRKFPNKTLLVGNALS